MQNQNVQPMTAMKDKVVMITGANSGIGKAASLALAKMGANVVMVIRNKEKGEAARSEIIRESQNGSVDLLLADLSSIGSVRSLATEFQKKYSRLHVLINNAGLFNQRRNVTTDGYENTFATNIWTRPLGPAGFIMSLPKLFMLSPQRGAETIVYLASSDEAGGLNGEYLEKLKVKKSSDESYDDEIAQRLWDVSEKLTHLSWPVPR